MMMNAPLRLGALLMMCIPLIASVDASYVSNLHERAARRAADIKESYTIDDRSSSTSYSTTTGTHDDDEYIYSSGKGKGKSKKTKSSKKSKDKKGGKGGKGGKKGDKGGGYDPSPSPAPYFGPTTKGYSPGPTPRYQPSNRVPTTSPGPTITASPTATPSPTKTRDPTVGPTASPTITGAPTVTARPTATPEPTDNPTLTPTSGPTITAAPTRTETPTSEFEPTVNPTVAPTVAPTSTPLPTAPTASQSPTTTPLPTAPTASQSPTTTPLPTAPTASQSPSITAMPTAPTASQSPSTTPLPTAPTASQSPTTTPLPTAPTASPAPTATPNPTRTAVPTRTPGSEDRPTRVPGSEDFPTRVPGSEDFPTRRPSKNDTPNPNLAPSFRPSPRPSPRPTPNPTGPNGGPTPNPTRGPLGPTNNPTPEPTRIATPRPSPTAPTVPDDGRRDLTPFGLAYTVIRPDTPGAIDYAEVALLTNNYLEAYFEALFSQTIFTRLDNFFTIFVTGNFFLNQPIQIDYESIAYFDVDESLTIPSATDLDMLLAQAFEGENLAQYLAQLSTLTSNIFSTTQTVLVVNSTSNRLTEDERQAGKDALLQDRNKSSSSTLTLLATIIGTSLGALALGGVAFIKIRRKRQNGRGRGGKSLEAPPPAILGNDDRTVASWAENSMAAHSKATPGTIRYVTEMERCLEGESITQWDAFEAPGIDGDQLETSPLFSSPPDADVEGGGDFRDVSL